MPVLLLFIIIIIIIVVVVVVVVVIIIMWVWNCEWRIWTSLHIYQEFTGRRWKPEAKRLASSLVASVGVLCTVYTARTCAVGIYRPTCICSACRSRLVCVSFLQCCEVLQLSCPAAIQNNAPTNLLTHQDASKTVSARPRTKLADQIITQIIIHLRYQTINTANFCLSNAIYNVFEKKFTLLVFTITKSDVDQFQ